LHKLIYMRSLELVKHLEDSDITIKLSQSRNELTYSRWQVLYLIQVGKINNASLLGPITNLSTSSIYKIVEAYNKMGIEAIQCKPRGGRRNAYLSIDEEKAIFTSIKDKANSGKVKTANDIRKIVEEKLGKKISDDYLWDLFKRNGWKKKVPRPYHPKRNLEAQEEFKKNSPTVWMP
jgi:transposase